MEIRQKKLTCRLSLSLKVIGTDTDLSATSDVLLVTMAPYLIPFPR